LSSDGARARGRIRRARSVAAFRSVPSRQTALERTCLDFEDTGAPAPAPTRTPSLRSASAALLSPHPKLGIPRELAEEDAAQEAGLYLENATIADAVVEDGMGDELVHAALEGEDEALACGRREGDGAGGGDEVVGADDAVVEGADDGRVSEDGSELLHEIEGEGGSTEMRLVIQAEQRVEAHGTNGQGELLGEERVAEGEQRVDRVPRRAAVAAVEIELERGTTLQHAGELGIVAPCRGAFDAEECLEGLGAARFARELLELRER